MTSIEAKKLSIVPACVGHASSLLVDIYDSLNIPILNEARARLAFQGAYSEEGE